LVHRQVRWAVDDEFAHSAFDHQRECFLPRLLVILLLAPWRGWLLSVSVIKLRQGSFASSSAVTICRKNKNQTDQSNYKLYVSHRFSFFMKITGRGYDYLCPYTSS